MNSECSKLQDLKFKDRDKEDFSKSNQSGAMFRIGMRMICNFKTIN